MGELNTIMTALADEVRALSGGANPLGIEAMTSSIDAANSEVGTQTDIIALIKEAANTLPDNNADEKWLTRSHIGSVYTHNTITSVNNGALACLSELTTVNLPACTYVGNRVFAYCDTLANVNLPVCKSIWTYAFSNCRSLTSIYLPECVNLKNAFMYCSRLTDVSVPKVEIIQEGTFNSCWKLSKLVLPNTCSVIYGQAFRYCFNLLSLTLQCPSVVTLSNTNAFTSSPISNYTTSTGGVYGSIYVPASLVSSYKTATNWATYADRITAIVEE